jgi:hypothetical protein
VTTTPPTPAEMDTWFSAMLPTIVGNAVANPGDPMPYWYAGYTQDDGQVQYTGILDPTSDPGSATVCTGLVAQYGAITVRAWSWTFPMPTPDVADMVLPDSAQAAINDQSAWITE